MATCGVAVLFAAVDVTGCYGDALYCRGRDSPQWLCDRCFCGSLTDVRISFVICDKIIYYTQVKEFVLYC